MCMANFILSSFADEAADSLDDQLRLSAQHGVFAIEMRSVDGKNIADLTPDEAREIAKKLRDHGFCLSAVGSPMGKISVADPFGPHLDQFRRCVETARILGARYIRMFSFYPPEGGDPAACRDEVMARLSRFVEACEGSGVACCHENEKGIYGNVPERCLDIFKTFPGKILGIFDPANFLQEKVETVPAWEMLAPYIEYFHVKDAHLADGIVTPAGKGDGYLPELLARFAQKSGDRFLTVEPHLALFSGFKNLESGSDNKTPPFTYSSREEAYGTAVGALQGILRGMGYAPRGESGDGRPLWSR